MTNYSKGSEQGVDSNRSSFALCSHVTKVRTKFTQTCCLWSAFFISVSIIF